MSRYRRVVFLDRDGTINIDPGYLTDPALVRLVPRAGEALGMLRRSGYELIVVSNQSAIGRGKATAEQVGRVNERVQELLVAEDSDAVIGDFLICPHIPEDLCRCRKPATGLVLEWCARRNSGELPRESWFVGDKESDLLCGRALGISEERCLQVLSGEGADLGTAVPSLYEAAKKILG